MKKRITTIGLALAVTGVLAIAGTGSKVVKADQSETLSEDDVLIDESNFPDKGFRDAVSEWADQDKDGVLKKSEILSTDYMYVNTEVTRSAKGIEIFTNLKELRCMLPGGYGTDDVGILEELDVSKNTKLEILECPGNVLTELDVSCCPKLTSLDCNCNQLTKLDVSKNPELLALWCRENEIGSLDLSNNKKMVSLECSGNLLETLDISHLSKLDNADCSWNQLTELKLGKHPDLVVFDCGSNQLTSLDVSGLPKVERLTFGDNKIKEIDLGNNPNLYQLECFENMLSKLDLSTVPNLEWIQCEGNQLTELDVSNNPELILLQFGRNKLKTIDISNNAKVKSLTCQENPLTQLDISAQTVFVDMVKNDKPEPCEWDPNGSYFYYRPEEAEESISRVVYVGVEGHFIQFTPGLEFVYTESTPTPTPTPTPVPKGTVGDFVERLYTEALGRDSEEDGKKYWTEEITSGRWTGGAVGRYFLMGEEFTNRDLRTEDFVETLYMTFFGRESEEDGKAFWVDSLNNGSMTREAVIDNFIDSKEWCNLCADYGVRSGAPTAKAERASEKATAFATRLYICCLGRDPEEKGLSYWALALTNLEQTGCSAAKEFFCSAEFTNLNLNDEEFVLRLYTTFMDREPEASEVSYWTGEIKKGTQTRDSVLAFFGSSEEFTNICAEYGIERGTIG